MGGLLAAHHAGWAWLRMHLLLPVMVDGSPSRRWAGALFPLDPAASHIAPVHLRDGPLARASGHLVAVSLHQHAAPSPWCQPLAGFPSRLPRFGGLGTASDIGGA